LNFKEEIKMTIYGGMQNPYQVPQNPYLTGGVDMSKPLYEEKKRGFLGNLLRNPKSLATGGMLLGAVGAGLIATGVGAPLGIAVAAAGIGAGILGRIGGAIGGHFQKKDQKNYAKQMLQKLEPWQVPDHMKKQFGLKDHEMGRNRAGGAQQAPPQQFYPGAMPMMSPYGMPNMGQFGQMPGMYPPTYGTQAGNQAPQAEEAKKGGGALKTLGKMALIGATFPISMPILLGKGIKNFLFGK
jgi:hypothetical protein